MEKTKATFYITAEIKDRFDKITKAKALNKSALVDLLIKEWVERNEKEEQR